ncbi:Fe(3+) ABC transporter substrate-binding protein [Cyanobacterium stanieri LEGE 03274]|uniref:Fe(3+) ABC transporter substrate-binding protein n=1 Tax=Cyanobacterium stanieri LEGE 03274 TaxID=1828756 RepID=A0ABR9V1I4_9CHRO|nr:Fe(3+) ABC transporter substrate-binding protein [Cyanobacterium stanieri]MBE9221755.1 Fe(3+) ABC transporter substrate-binding protein [Cyanobacterium stanieri LEGE 03274]
MSNISRRKFLGASAAATLATVSLRELIQAGEASAQGQQINLYSSRHYNTDQRLYTDFERLTGIKVNLIEGNGDELFERIQSEGNNSPADIFMTVNAANLWRAQQAGLFSPVNSSTLRNLIPSYLRDPGNNWFAFSKRARVIIYNKENVNPNELSTYQDLTDTKWRNRLVMRSSSNIYNQSLTAGMIANYGADATENWCRGLVSNFLRPPQGNDRAQIETVASGVAHVTCANTYYLGSYRSSNDPNIRAVLDKIGVFFPDQDGPGTHINISGAGVLRNAPNRAGAIAFLEYLLSAPAQNYFALGNTEYPVVEGVAIDPLLRSFGTFKEDTSGVFRHGPNSAAAIRIMDRAGWA